MPVHTQARYDAGSVPKACELFTESNGRALGILSTGDPGGGPCTNPDEKNVYAPVSTILDRVNARTGMGFEIATQGPYSPPSAPRPGRNCLRPCRQPS
ncbi:hypothetical protein [Micromonospora sp. KC213]|uniref:hypothetical protein n=1 Tax=Micromonospora sp. KC213 TaxID=2530378 RepID=UPI0010490A3E|nr:hypothetical protein [Micromonospora sp. KC213]TDC37040.1 hypothetical protein E1166_21050 [Micromonospora sp. KC213]